MISSWDKRCYMFSIEKRLKKLEEKANGFNQEQIIADYLNAVSLYVTDQDFEKEMDNLELDNFNFNVFQNSVKLQNQVNSIVRRYEDS